MREGVVIISKPERVRRSGFWDLKLWPWAQGNSQPIWPFREWASKINSLTSLSSFPCLPLVFPIIWIPVEARAQGNCWCSPLSGAEGRKVETGCEEQIAHYPKNVTPYSWQIFLRPCSLQSCRYCGTYTKVCLFLQGSCPLVKGKRTTNKNWIQRQDSRRWVFRQWLSATWSIRWSVIGVAQKRRRWLCS